MPFCNTKELKKEILLSREKDRRRIHKFISRQRRDSEIHRTILVTEKIQNRVNPAIIAGKRSWKVLADYYIVPETAGSSRWNDNRGLKQGVARFSGSLSRKMSRYRVSYVYTGFCIGYQRIYARIHVYFCSKCISRSQWRLIRETCLFSENYTPPFLR